MRKFGLIGFPLSHSFSKKYFSDKFENEGLEGCQYDLYEISDVALLKNIIDENPQLEGINVTIPYKEKVLPFLDTLDPACRSIGAVNCIKIKEGKLTGFNTDYYGFKESLENWLGHERPKALVLGTGGASKAIVQALKDLQIEFLQISRSSFQNKFQLTYDELSKNPEILKSHHLIVNTTPLGTYPNTEVMPEIDLASIDERHKVYDLVYNPNRTFLMRSMEARGAQVKNGLEMLHLQAEAAWKIWN